MKSLRSKILLAMIASALLGIVVLAVMSRVSLQLGFMEFVERQEARQLTVLAPALARVYQESGGWGDWITDPRRWHNLISRSAITPQSGGPPRRDSGLKRPPPPRRDVLQFRDRLFLLDPHHRQLAGSKPEGTETRNEDSLEAVVVDGAVVGWLGFTPLRRAATPEARLFLAGQQRAVMVSVIPALLLAGLLGFVLARHISRPVTELRSTVRSIADGDYEARSSIDSRDETGALAAGVNRLAETLKKNETARRRWTADIAHELRTPIAILRGELEAVEDGIRSVDEQTIRSLREEIRILTDLVDDLQTLALADAGALRLHLQSVDVSELLRQAEATWRDRFEERGLRLRLVAPDGMEMIGDAQRLRQVVSNLLENAVRYTGVGGWLEIELTAVGETVELRVEDSGPGVETDQLERIFDRFYRAEGSRGRSGGGSGLGLAICRNIIETHGGTIIAEHGSQGGLALLITLPRGAVDA